MRDRAIEGLPFSGDKPHILFTKRFDRFVTPFVCDSFRRVASRPACINMIFGYEICTVNWIVKKFHIRSIRSRIRVSKKVPGTRVKLAH